MPDKEVTLQLVDEEYQKLREAIDGLDARQLSRPWLDGWSVRDLIAHILGWEREMIGFLQRMARGERPNPEGVDYSKPDEWNAKFALEMAPVGPETVLAVWRHVHMNFVSAAKALPDERFGEGKTANRLLEGNGFEHYREHAAHIREWRQSEGI